MATVARHRAGGDVRFRRVRVAVRRRRRPAVVRRVALWLGGAALALLVADGVWSTVGLGAGLSATRQSLGRAASALVDGRLGAAERAFERAESAADRALAFSRHPAPRIATLLPFVGDDVRALQTLASSASLTASAGSATVESARAVGWDGEGLPGFADGRVRLAPIRAASEPLEEAAALATRAESLLASTPSSGLTPFVADAVGAAKAEIGERAALMRRASDLTVLLPSFLGGEAPRRYLIAIQNLSAPRGSGGYLGSYGVLVADDGDVRLERLEPAGSLRPVEPVEAPRDVARRYRRFGGLTHLIASNYSPDFPTAAELAIAIYERSTGDRVDGVIAADSVWMSYVLGAIGPVEVRGAPQLRAGTEKVEPEPEPVSVPARAPAIPKTSTGKSDAPAAAPPAPPPRAPSSQSVDDEALASEEVSIPTTLTAENVSRVLNHDTFLLTEARSEAAQAQIGLSLWRGLLEGPLPMRGLGDAMDRAARERHLQVYSRAPAEQGVLRTLGVAGEVRLEHNPLYVVWQDATANRAGYFARKRVSHDVELATDGTATVTTEILLDNRAPNGPPSILLGDGKSGDPIGYFAAYVNVYLPPGATNIRMTSETGGTLDLLEEEFGHPVLMGYLGAGPGSRAVLRVTYRVPEAAAPSTDGYRWEAGLLPQPALHAEHVELNVTLPDGSDVLGSSGLAAPIDGSDRVSFSGPLSEPRLVALEWRGP